MERACGSDRGAGARGGDRHRRQTPPGAPAAVRTAAVELLAKSIRTGPEIAGVHFADQQVDYQNYGPALIRRCGASSMLSPWRRPRGRVIGAAS